MILRNIAAPRKIDVTIATQSAMTAKRLGKHSKLRELTKKPALVAETRPQQSASTVRCENFGRNWRYQLSARSISGSDADKQIGPIALFAFGYSAAHLLCQIWGAKLAGRRWAGSANSAECVVHI